MGTMKIDPKIYAGAVPNGKFTITKVQEASPPISGTY